MGQLSAKIREMTEPEPRVLYDEAGDNGLLFRDMYIPAELLSEILCYVDYKTLNVCQLVCKRWNSIIKDYVWRKKAEMVLHCPLPVDQEAPWTMYALICHKKPFNKNLIKDSSRENRISSDWIVVIDGGEGWNVERPPIGVPRLPDDPVFNEKNQCFVTSYSRCWKMQVIDLVKEGFSTYLLDKVKPTIKVSEWYSCRWDCPAEYLCVVELFKEKIGFGQEIVLDTFAFSKILENEEQNQWFKFEHEFKNYSEGLRRIRFSHGGQDRNFWAGHYGSKMAGTCITVEIPESYKNIKSYYFFKTLTAIYNNIYEIK